MCAALATFTLSAGRAAPSLVGEAPPPDAPWSLWFRKPASSFLESCPVGNGRLGGMLFGGIPTERVVLNEQTLWSGSVQAADRENAHQVLPEIRRLLFEGKNREAQELLSRNFICQGPGSSNGSAEEGPFGCYQTLGDLLLDFGEVNAEVRDYRRDLDLDSARTSAIVRPGSDGTCRTATLWGDTRPCLPDPVSPVASL